MYITLPLSSGDLPGCKCNNEVTFHRGVVSACTTTECTLSTTLTQQPQWLHYGRRGLVAGRGACNTIDLYKKEDAIHKLAKTISEDLSHEDSASTLHCLGVCTG